MKNKRDLLKDDESVGLSTIIALEFCRLAVPLLLLATVLDELLFTLIDEFVATVSCCWPLVIVMVALGKLLILLVLLALVDACVI